VIIALQGIPGLLHIVRRLFPPDKRLQHLAEILLVQQRVSLHGKASNLKKDFRLSLFTARSGWSRSLWVTIESSSRNAKDEGDDQEQQNGPGHNSLP